MKNGLLRFYLVFMVVALALFSCENHDLTQDKGRSSQNTIERKPDGRVPTEPNGTPVEGQKSKKIPRRTYSRSSNLC
ncbi:MAG: hypothetical protein H7336_16965 [Bacteriovorax sp.]|nr:hypothetical protein [Bacteriovorax sp.]